MCNSTHINIMRILYYIIYIQQITQIFSAPLIRFYISVKHLVIYVSLTQQPDEYIAHLSKKFPGIYPYHHYLSCYHYQLILPIFKLCINKNTVCVFICLACFTNIIFGYSFIFVCISNSFIWQYLS